MARRNVVDHIGLGHKTEAQSELGVQIGGQILLLGFLSRFVWQSSGKATCKKVSVLMKRPRSQDLTEGLRTS